MQNVAVKITMKVIYVESTESIAGWEDNSIYDADQLYTVMMRERGIKIRFLR